jgi:hypothetical protein
MSQMQIAYQNRTTLSNAESRSLVRRLSTELLKGSKVSERRFSTAKLISKTWRGGDLIALESAQGHTFLANVLRQLDMREQRAEANRRESPSLRHLRCLCPAQDSESRHRCLYRLGLRYSNRNRNLPTQETLSRYIGTSLSAAAGLLCCKQTWQAVAEHSSQSVIPKCGVRV